MQLNHKVDENEVLGEGYEIIPAGEYPAVITASEMKDTKSGTGKYLNLQWQIIDGKYKGRVLFSMIHLFNQNPTAVEIAKKTLNTIALCCGLSEVRDSAELHNTPMNIKIAVKEDPAYGPKNEIKNYKPIGKVQQKSATAPASAGSNPWEV